MWLREEKHRVKVEHQQAALTKFVLQNPACRIITVDFSNL
jgi:hypothetical protein